MDESTPEQDQSQELCPLCFKAKCSVYHKLVLSKVSHGAFRLWHCINAHSNRNGKSFPGYRRLADLIHCKVDSIGPWLNELAEHGFLQIDSKGAGSGKSNTYTIVGIKPFPKKGTLASPKKGTPNRPPKRERSVPPKGSITKELLKRDSLKGEISLDIVSERKANALLPDAPAIANAAGDQRKALTPEEKQKLVTGKF